jgi:beta-mannosidase
MAATVPGTVHTDLVAAGVIPDPFYGDNERRLQWIEGEDWEYRTEFTATPTNLARERQDLVFEGLDTYADVSLNGTRVLTTNNMFRRWVAHVEDVLVPGTNTLVVRFTSPRSIELPLVDAHPYRLPIGNDTGDPPTRAFTRKAAYHYGWDWGARFVTSGIWRPVTLRSWSGARISDVWVRQGGVTDERAAIDVQVSVVADTAMPALVRVRTSDRDRRSDDTPVELRAGENVITVPFAIAEPELWWPRGLGSQHRYDLVVEVEAGQYLDRAEKRFGVRTVEVVTDPDSIGESFYLRVNGRPIFAKGANYIPLDHFTPRVSAHHYRALFDDVAAANMNMLRVWGGGIYEDDTFYDLADEYGILVWQDFMFANAMYPGDAAFLDNVRREAEDNVRRLRGHPSIALWCGNNEIDEAWHNWGWQAQYGMTPTHAAAAWETYQRIFHEILPDVVTTLDPDRFYWPSSPSIGWGHDSSLTKGDAHYWGVWHGRFPFTVFRERLPRFMSEFGFQAFPSMATMASFAPSEDLNLDSPALQTHQKAPDGNGRIREYMGRWYRPPRDFASFVYVSQLLQAEGMRIAFEAHRAAKPRTMGTLYWQLDDTWPVVSWSSRDYFGRWKALHYAVRDAFADPLVSIQNDGDSIWVRVVTDGLDPVSGTITLSLLDFEGDEHWTAVRRVAVPANGNVVAFGTTLTEILGGVDPKGVVLRARLDHEGTSVPRLHYFVPPKDLRLPPDPGLEVRSGWQGSRRVLLVSTHAFAKNVWLHANGVEGHFSDNYFDLLPGEPRLVRFEPDGPWMIPMPSFSARSLVETAGYSAP